MIKNEEGKNVFRGDNEEIEIWGFYKIRKELESFVHIFKAECRDNETYFIERKAIYDTASLLNCASNRIHQSIRDQISKAALDEIDQAGRCFAVDSYTACGFHALRGLEIVMEDYHEAITGKSTNFKSWHEYVTAFKRLSDTREERKSKFPSPKVAAMIDRIRELDRNPLMHPRDTLDEPGADTVFNISVATITEMAKDITAMKIEQEEPPLPLDLKG